MDTPESTLEPQFTLFSPTTITFTMDSEANRNSTVYRQEDFLTKPVYGETATFSGGNLS